MSCLRKVKFKTYEYVRIHKDIFSDCSYCIWSSIRTLQKYLNELIFFSHKSAHYVSEVYL
jgi:hypothetical protein